MRLKLAVAAVAAVVIGQPAFAAPVYLDCTIPNEEGGQQPWTISLNEEAGTLTFSHSLRTGTTRAVFTPDKVIWADGDLYIDRATLAFTRHARFGGKELSPPEVGTCKVSAKKRAF